MIPGAISVVFGGKLLLMLLIAVVLIILAVLFYRFTLPPLPFGRRLLFSALRATALTLLLALLFEPVLRMINRDQQPAAVAVLVDNSESMTISDRAGDRAELVQKYLTDELPQQFQSAEVIYYPFSTTLEEKDKNFQPESLSFRGETTNLSNAFEKLKAEIPRENIQAVLLLSDGNYTEGKNPVYDAENLQIPVYTVGFGDTTPQKDIVVERVLTNSITYAGTRVPVDVNIRSSGYAGRTVDVTLSDGQTVVDRKSITFTGAATEYPLNLTFEAMEEGTKKYTVAVSRLQGELTTRNNTRPIFVKILKSKLKVLLLAGAPSPDVSIIRQTLNEDQQLSVESRIQRDAGSFYEGNLNQTLLDSSDCLVLIGYPSKDAGGDALQRLRDAVEKHKKPVLYIHGRNVDYGKLQVLESVLPFRWERPTTAEVTVFPEVASQARRHPIINVAEGSVSQETWQQLPPLFKTQTTFRAKPEAEAIVFAKLQGVTLNEPLLAVRTLNRQKTLAITGHGIWRWRLLAQGSRQTERFFPAFLSNTIRWLTTRDDDKNVRITPVKETFTTAEPAAFTAQVYDEQFRPVDNATLTVELQHGNDKTTIALDAFGNGRYEGAATALPEGDYTFTGRAVADGKVLGEDRGRFSVGQVNVEFLDTRMNRQLLEQIAERTGGRFYFHNTNYSVLAADLGGSRQFTPKELIQSREIELWNWQYLAAGIILLLAAEWFLRRRNGML